MKGEPPSRPLASPPHLRSFATAEHVTEAIYGTIILLSVLAVLSEYDPSVPEAASSIAGTSLVLFVAHVYAGVIAASIAQGRRLRRHELIRLADVYWPIVAVTGWPLALIGLAGLGLLDLSTALLVAVWLSVASLGFWGWYAGRAITSSPLGRLWAAGSSLVFGLMIVGLKVFFH